MSHRHDVWGDNPEEREADEVVAEVLAEEADLSRRWHDHPAIVPFKVVARFIGRNGKRIGVTIAGAVLLLLGVAGLALPILPGWLLIFAGFAVLSTEYIWAERMLKRARRAASAAKDKAVERKNARAARRAMKRNASEAAGSARDD